jgi:hypothetical protein
MSRRCIKGTRDLPKRNIDRSTLLGEGVERPLAIIGAVTRLANSTEGYIVDAKLGVGVVEDE